MPYSTIWNGTYEASPTDYDYVSNGAEAIRVFKTGIRERLASDHYFDINGVDADHGEHTVITFHEPTTNPGYIANKGFIYTKDVDDVVELFFLDEVGNEVEITRKGQLNSSSGFSTGDYTINFPTTNLSDNMVVMTGNSSTIAWFYNNVAPPGWVIHAVGADTVLAVPSTIGGDTYFSDGGTQVGDWSITGPSGETGEAINRTNELIYAEPDSGGMFIPLFHNHATTGGSSSEWRPKASIGRLFILDSA